MTKQTKITATVLVLALSISVAAQQVPDTSFVFPVGHPAYQPWKGPVIYIDEAHHNFHTRDGGFLPFARLLERDGYRVDKLDKTITSIEILKNCKILVIANALNAINAQNWVLPTPSAFTPEEIETIKSWVEKGGSLFLIADHMPFAGAAYELGKAFGFEFLNGFAFTGNGSWPPSTFPLKNKTLAESPVTMGDNNSEKIDSIATFTGSAFKPAKGSIPVLRFLDEHYSLQPDTAWSFNGNTPKQNLGGYCQGALLKTGKGRIAVFGEAAMFTAQIANGTLKAGFNSETAPDNAQFLLNLIHWLDGR